MSIQHIGFIMDGNGRWAKEKNKPRTFGHEAGARAVREVALGAIKADVKYISLYAFSTENWKRPKAEVEFIFGLISKSLYKEIPFFNDNGMKLLLLGDISVLPNTAQEVLNEIADKTKHNDKLIIQLALNYGGQAEICNAVNLAIKDGIKEITPQVIRSYFNNPEVPAVDLIVRTGGLSRLSNFLLFDSAYAELKFINKYWPDMAQEDVEAIVKEFNSITRNFGGLK